MILDFRFCSEGLLTFTECHVTESESKSPLPFQRALLATVELLLRLECYSNEG
jgi:hypothetical protein